MSAIPPSIRKILDSGRGEVAQLEQQYHIWLLVTVLSVGAGVILLGVSLMLFLLETNENLTLVRLLIGLAAGADLIVAARRTVPSVIAQEENKRMIGNPLCFQVIHQVTQ